ncbi:MAG: squalene/phytoene synthase family protein [Pseudomonadota bacterium]
MTIDDLSPLAQELRAANSDYYLSTLFAPPAVRPALVALYAFDGELARIRNVVREPMAGLIRLQWWEDVIDGFDGGGTIAHPVVEGLKRAVLDHALDAVCLKRAIEGRRRPFEMDVSPDQGAFERYLLDVGGNIAIGAAKLLGADKQQTVDCAARAGQVRAVWEQLSAFGTAAADREPWLPSAWLEESSDTGAMAARTRLAAWGLAELGRLRRESPSTPRPFLAAFFPGTLAGMRLRNPTGGSSVSTLPTAVPRLIWCWLRRRF